MGLGVVDLVIGPAKCCWATSAARYSSTTSGCCNALSKFLFVDLSMLGGLLNPILKC